MRDAMIEISGLVGMRLTAGGSTLTKEQIEEAVASAQEIVERGEELLEWLGKGNFAPVQR